MSRSQEIAGMLKGVQIVTEAIVKEQRTYTRYVWMNSSIREALEQNFTNIQGCAGKVFKDPGKEFEGVGNFVKEAFERSSVVTQGIKQYVVPNMTGDQSDKGSGMQKTGSVTLSGDQKVDLSDLDISQVTLKELEGILSEIKQKKVRLRFDDKKKKDTNVATDVVQRTDEQTSPPNPTPVQNLISIKSHAKIISPKPESLTKDVNTVKGILNIVANYGQDNAIPPQPQIISNEIKLPELSDVAKQRKVPSTRIGRVISFGNLFAGLGFGTVKELTKGALGIGGTTNVKEAVLSPDNTEKIVDTLCKVRGAALKLGQILSE